MKYSSVLQVQREQILAEAKLEIQKHEEKASFNEDFARDLKSQTDLILEILISDVLLKSFWKPVLLLIGFNKKYQTKNEFYMKIVSKDFVRQKQFRGILNFTLMNFRRLNYRKIKISSTIS